MSIKLYDLINKYDFNQVFSKLSELYPETSVHCCELKDTYCRLNGYIKYNNPNTVLYKIDDSYKITIEKDKSGKYYATVSNGKLTRSLDYEKWEQIVGWDITENTLKTIPELDILACVLTGITTISYDPYLVQRMWKDLQVLTNEMCNINSLI